MAKAGRDPGLGTRGLEGQRKARQPVHHRDEDILDVPVAQVVQDLCPEFDALMGLEPRARNVPCAIRQDRQRHEDGLVRDRAGSRILTRIAPMNTTG